MNETLSRVLLYGGATVLLAGLGVWAANQDRDADVLTLLSSADVQLRLAHGIPAQGPDGTVIPARAEMITAAEEHIAIVERLQPGMAVPAEFRGFAHMLRGEYAAAAAAYGRARGCKDCQAEQRDVLVFNQARMLAKAGQAEQALALFGEHGEALDRRFGHQRVLEEAALLRGLGKTADAEQKLAVVVADAAAPPFMVLQTGIEYLELGRLDAAERSLTRAQREVPIADYYLARLKLRQGDADTCLVLLERAAKALPTEVGARLRDEAAAWSAVAADARFQELVKPRPATPVR